MGAFGRRKDSVSAPRLAPELDDADLGRVRNRLSSASPRTPGQAEVDIVVVEQLMREAANDGDRRTHRVSVLADVAGSLAARWARNRPDDPDALLLTSWCHLAEARRNEQYGTLWSALRACERSARAHPADPAPWVAALCILRLLERPRAEVEPVWRKVMARDPWNREAYLQLLGYLSPMEQGSYTDMRSFVEDAHAVMPPGAAASGLALTAEVLRYQRERARGGIAAIEAAHLWYKPDITRLVDDAIQTWPQPGFLVHAAAIADLNTLAYAAVRTARPERAADVFRRIGGLVSPWPWSQDGDAVEQFSFWHHKLLG